MSSQIRGNAVQLLDGQTILVTAAVGGFRRAAVYVPGQQHAMVIRMLFPFTPFRRL
jgi:hypothetical protein